MARYTHLGPSDLDDIAARFGLESLTSCEPLWAGTINSNFRLESPRATLFLRVNEGKTEDDVAYEAELVTYLADRGVPTPRPLAARDGRPFAEVAGRLVTLFPWAQGRHPDPPRPEDAHAAGAALARVHLAGEGFGRRRESRYALTRIIERARAIIDPPAHVAPVLDDVRAELDAIARGLSPALPRGIIHGDLFPDNVLVGEDAGGGAILLDFEQASDGLFVYDLAVLILSWCWRANDLDPALVTAMRAGYASVRELTPVEEEALLGQARLAAARFTVTRLTDIELNSRASPELRAAKDFREFYARLGRLRTLTSLRLPPR